MKKQFNFDFIKNRKIFFFIVLAVFAIGLIFNFIFGTQLDIQFRGGTIVSYLYNGEINSDEAASLIESTIGMDVNVQGAEDRITGSQKLVVTLSGNEKLTTEQLNQVNAALAEKYSDTGIEYLESNSVDATMGHEFFMKALVACALAALLMIIYVGIRFRKIGGISAGIVAVIALLHDAMIIYFSFVILRIPLNDTFIAAVLTIIGYSINSTIVIYDRIRENRRLLGPKVPIADVVNLSINQSLTRSINTTISTMIAIGTVCVFALIFGISSILTFAFPLLVGLVAGFFSSVCISGPLWVLWKQFREKRALAKEGK